MIKWKMTMLWVLLVSFGALAQQNERLERVKALKVAFFTERLDLSPEEAEAFWPIYNAHETRMQALRQRERDHKRESGSDIATMTDKEAEAVIKEILVQEKERAQEKERFIMDMGKTLSPKKTLLLLQAETDFKRQLLRQYGQKRRGRP
ncbi:hypothetical protein [Maribacter sp. 2307ULW6-5]|uniref:hypothetical protein n=1 Tax=Maribacter sp. 2307ULW6-5 TaxID=3386275 RepID=UPI0039BC3C0C